MRYLRLYPRFFLLQFRMMGQYRLNAVIWLVFGLAWHGANIGVVWAMLQAFPVLNGWTFPEMLFLYALWNLAHAVFGATFFKLSGVSGKVQSGQLDGFLVRPLGPLYQILTEPSWLDVYDLLIAVPLFLFAQDLAGVEWAWTHLLVLPLAVLGGALIKGGVLLAVSTLSFWTVRMESAQVLIESIELQFVRFPLTIFSRPAQWLFTFLIPLAFVAFLPAQLFLGKGGNSTFLNPALGYLTPLAGLVAFGLAYAFWRFGLARYQSTGS